MKYKTKEDKKEWEETYGLMSEGDTISVNLSNGDFVVIKKEMFDSLISELNQLRIDTSVPGEEVELIIVDEGNESENN